MANTVADQPALKAGEDVKMEGMSHSEVHYFNSYNHHGIHEEMLVCTCPRFVAGYEVRC